MGFFSKKICDICGFDIGRIGARKLEDGYLCKECTKKLSPFFGERRTSTVDQIRDQLNYREANQNEVAGFNVTHTLGLGTKVLLDEDAGKFLVSSSNRWREENPDVMAFSQVTGCDAEIRESRTELRYENADGQKVSYNPPRYDIDYDVYLTIHVNTPYFDEIGFKLNSSRIEDRHSIEFKEAERQATQIREALTQVRQETRDAVVAANAPKEARICPHCRATTIPDANGCCEYCSGAMV